MTQPDSVTESIDAEIEWQTSSDLALQLNGHDMVHIDIDPDGNAATVRVYNQHPESDTVWQGRVLLNAPITDRGNA